MQVYLLRHGIAEELQAGKSDSDRALTAAGRSKLRETLRVAADAQLKPSLILTSPLLRAVETAEIARSVLRYSGDLLRTKALVPDAQPEGVWDEIRIHHDQPEILLVGHEPLFSQLAAFLLGAPNIQVDFKKGAILRVDFESIGIRPRGILRWFLTAKLARHNAPAPIRRARA